MNSKNTQKVVFLKGNAHKKNKNTHKKKCENANVDHKMQTCKKTNSLFKALMLRMSYTLNEATPETQNIREIRKKQHFKKQYVN